MLLELIKTNSTLGLSATLSERIMYMNLYQSRRQAKKHPWNNWVSYLNVLGDIIDRMVSIWMRILYKMQQMHKHCHLIMNYLSSCNFWLSPWGDNKIWEHKFGDLCIAEAHSKGNLVWTLVNKSIFLWRFISLVFII